jgi:hypothetical protein
VKHPRLKFNNKVLLEDESATRNMVEMDDEFLSKFLALPAANMD